MAGAVKLDAGASLAGLVGVGLRGFSSVGPCPARWPALRYVAAGVERQASLVV